MTVAQFLADLANKLELGPENVGEYRSWARQCRDYAMISTMEADISARALVAALARSVPPSPEPAKPKRRKPRLPDGTVLGE